MQSIAHNFDILPSPMKEDLQLNYSQRELCHWTQCPKRKLWFVSKLNRQKYFSETFISDGSGPVSVDVGRGMISHVQNFYCIIQTLNIITCSFLMPFIFQSFFHHLSLFILSFYHFLCLRLLIVCMTMILHTQVLASQRSWKCVWRLQSNLKLRAGLSTLS